MNFIGNSGPMPTEKTLRLLRDGSKRANPGANWRVAAFFCAFIAILLTAIAFFSDRDGFPVLATALSAVSVSIGVIATLRSSRQDRWFALTWTLLGALPVVSAALLPLTP